MLIGREKETAMLLDALEREEAQLIAVYGRRRVGKTYLIRESLRGRFTFQHSGVYQGTRAEQLRAFCGALTDAGFPAEYEKPDNWMDAFQLLKRLIQESTQQKKIVFLDELSWMDTPKSDFMKAL